MPYIFPNIQLYRNGLACPYVLDLLIVVSVKAIIVLTRTPVRTLHIHSLSIPAIDERTLV